MSAQHTSGQEPKWEIRVRGFKHKCGANITIVVQEMGLFDHDRPAMDAGKLLLNWLHKKQWDDKLVANAPKDYENASHEVFALRSIIADWGGDPTKVLVTVREYGRYADSDELDVEEYATAMILEAAA